MDAHSPVGNVFGIDVSHINPKILDKLLKGDIQLSDYVEHISGQKTNLSQFNRDIQFVYIKAIGTAPFSKELKKGKATPYKELAEVCKKNKIPFGFYCYSTAKTLEEAKQEYNLFSETIKQIQDNPYHLLPLAIDVEVANTKDRHYSASMKDVTNSKIALANLLEKDFGKTILYVPRNAYNKNLKSRILDLEQYQKGISSGNSDIWHVTPIGNKLHKQSMVEISEHVTANQIALDVKVNNNRNNLVDINLIDKEAFEKYTSGRYKKLALETNKKEVAKATINKSDINNKIDENITIKEKVIAQNEDFEREM